MYKHTNNTLALGGIHLDLSI